MKKFWNKFGDDWFMIKLYLSSCFVFGVILLSIAVLVILKIL